MEPAVASAMDNIKGAFKAVFQKKKDVVVVVKDEDDGNRHHHNTDPINILKRLQREAFSDLMKLRDRQDKIERVLLSKIPGKGSLFQEAGTRVRGTVDVVGALFLAGVNCQKTVESLTRAGVKMGVESRITFETIVRQKDALIAEFLASNKISTHHENSPSPQLALEKVMYMAAINDWLSVTTSPLGAQCKDFGWYSSSLQGLGISASFPPLFNKYRGCAAGFIIKGQHLNVALAELVTECMSCPSGSSFATFGQFCYEPFDSVKVNMSGLWEVPRSPFRQMKIGALAIPLFSPGRTNSYMPTRSSNAGVTRSPKETIPDECVSLMFEADINSSSRVGGWVQMQKKRSDCAQWSVCLSDTPDNELGWGLRVGGFVEGHVKQYQLEGFLKFNIGDRFCLQPGMVYTMEDRSQNHIMTLHSVWSL